MVERIYPEVPEELVYSCLRSGCVLFAGSYLSAQAGYPDRFQILKELINQQPRVSHADKVELLGMLDPEEVFSTSDTLDVVTELLASLVPRDDLTDGLESIYANVKSWPAPIFQDLKNIPFTSALTFNWDNLLEETFGQRNPLVVTGAVERSRKSVLTDAFNPQHFTIAKLFGSLDDPSSMRLTTDEYRLTLSASNSFSRLLVTYAGSHSLLFLGASLTDIQTFFSGMPSRPELRVHYALVPAGPGSLMQQRRFESIFGVHLLFYQIDQQSLALARFVRELRELVERESSPRVPIAHVPTDTNLGRVRLRNIGPFERLELSLNSTWNVVLGNNGSGKSTLLKAIALGLCGDDAESSIVGGRLLKVGQNSGFIEIEIGGASYRTDLFREDERVRVECKQVTPLLRGDIAALGFPPLRGNLPGSMTSLSFTPGPAKSVVADVLPLLAGTFDNRLDILKSWLIYLFVNSGPQVDEDLALRTTRQRDSFFNILHELTPGTRIEWGDVDLQRWQVYVHTADGKVPFDQISQGLTSLFGWTGTTIQRLAEIYPNSANPENEPVLLLLDEVDAHLHPEWQQVLVRLTRKLFPRMQVVATTHSPLIVAGMRANEVLVAKRDYYTKIVSIAQAPVEIEGMRADQILTSPLFGLLTTRSATVASDIDRYSTLRIKKQRTLSEEDELRSLRERLETTLLSGETKLERTVEEAIDRTIKTMIEPQNIYSEASLESVEMRTEIRRQLDKLIPSSTENDTNLE